MSRRTSHDDSTSSSDFEDTRKKSSGSGIFPKLFCLGYKKRRHKVSAGDIPAKGAVASPAREPEAKPPRRSLLQDDNGAASAAGDAAARAVVTAAGTAARPTTSVSARAEASVSASAAASLAAGDVADDIVADETYQSERGVRRSSDGPQIQLSQRVRVRCFDTESLGSEYSVQLNASSPPLGTEPYCLTGIRTMPDRTLRPQDRQQPESDQHFFLSDQQLSSPDDQPSLLDEDLSQPDSLLPESDQQLPWPDQQFLAPVLTQPTRRGTLAVRNRSQAKPGQMLLFPGRSSQTPQGSMLPTPQGRLLPTPGPSLPQGRPSPTPHGEAPTGRPLSTSDQQLCKQKTTVPSKQMQRKAAAPESLSQAVLALAESGRRLQKKQQEKDRKHKKS